MVVLHWNTLLFYRVFPEQYCSISSENAIMLFNSKGRQVLVSEKLNSHNAVNVFIPLREKLIPARPYQGKMFKIETRATFKA